MIKTLSSKHSLYRIELNRRPVIKLLFYNFHLNIDISKSEMKWNIDVELRHIKLVWINFYEVKVISNTKNVDEI
jgi:hypothetical protein